MFNKVFFILPERPTLELDASVGWLGLATRVIDTYVVVNTTCCHISISGICFT